MNKYRVDDKDELMLWTAEKVWTPSRLVDADNPSSNVPFESPSTNNLEQLESKSVALQIKKLVFNEIENERAVGNFSSFIPVGLVLGIHTYFTAKSEPSFFVLLLSMICIFGLARFYQNHKAISAMLFAVALVLAGMSAAKIQVDRKTVPIPISQFTANIAGVILKVDENRRGAPRYLIKPIEIQNYDDSQLPERVRLSSSKSHEPYRAGQTISGLARMASLQILQPSQLYPF